MGALDNDKLTIGDILPALREGNGPMGNNGGVQQVVSVPMGPPLLVDGATYKQAAFVAPVDGCQIKRLMISAAVTLAGGTNTLAFDNYDASANAARNVLSTATVDPAVTAKEGTQLTLTTTAANLLMDKGDVLNFTFVCGTMTTDGEGYAVTAVITVPDIL